MNRNRYQREIELQTAADERTEPYEPKRWWSEEWQGWFKVRSRYDRDPMSPE